MIKLYFKIIIISLFSTTLIEVICSYLFKIRNKKDIINIILVNIMTNPLLVTILIYINIMFGLKYRNILVYPLEILVVLIEGLVYKKYLSYKKINPFVLSLVLNSLSYILGLLINNIVY